MFKRTSTSKFKKDVCEKLTIIIYIKPFDDEVFTNFIKILKFL